MSFIYEQPRSSIGDTFAGGGPPPFDWMPVIGIAAIIAVILLFTFWRSIAMVLDQTFISGLAAGVQGGRRIKAAVKRLIERVIERADRPS